MFTAHELRSIGGSKLFLGLLLLGCTAFFQISSAQASSFDPGSANLAALGKATMNGPSADAEAWRGDNRGDFNGDNIDDVVTGAPYSDPFGRNNAGSAYVMFGKRGFSNINMSGIPANQGLAIYGYGGANLGMDVAFVPDINGDGADEVVVGAPDQDTPTADDGGSAYIIWGRPARRDSAGNLINDTVAVDTSLGEIEGAGASAKRRYTRIDGTDSHVDFDPLRPSTWTGHDDDLGMSVAGGDYDGDGIGDFALGAPGAENTFDGDDSGIVYLFYGFARMATIRTDGEYFGRPSLDSSAWWNNVTPTTRNGVTEPDGPAGRHYARVFSGSDTNDDAGISVSFVGHDLAIGASNAYTWNGSDWSGTSAPGVAYLARGGQNLGGALNLEDTSNIGPNMRISYGDDGNDDYADSVGDAGDINKDGIRDFIVGAPDSNPIGRDNAGSATVIYGTPWPGRGRNATSIVNGMSPGAQGILFAGTLRDDTSFGIYGAGHRREALHRSPETGQGVGFAGDQNGDGFGDAVIGAPGLNANGDDGGQVYIIFSGNNAGGMIDLDSQPLDHGFFRILGTGDEAAVGPGDEEMAGEVVGGGGDNDGDGKPDLLIGSAGLDTLGNSDSGGVHIITANQRAGGGGPGGGSTPPPATVKPTAVAPKSSGSGSGSSGGSTGTGGGTKPPKRCPALSSKVTRSKSVKLRKKLSVRLEAPASIRSGTGSGKALIRLNATTKKGKKLLKKYVRQITFKRGLKKLSIDSKYPFTTVLRNDINPGTVTIVASLKMKKKGAKKKTLKLKVKLAAPCGK